MGMTKNWFTDDGNACLVVVLHRHHKFLRLFALFRDGLLDLETTSDQTLAFGETDELSLEI